MAKKPTHNERYEKEYLDRLAFGLVQFWPVGEELPDDEARESEVFYKVSIRRLSMAQRSALVKKLWRMATKTSGVFVPELRGTDEAKQMVAGVIARFPLLMEVI